MSPDWIRRFKFARFTFYIRFAEKPNLRGFLGSTIRGGLGHALKRVTCIDRTMACSDCTGRFQCPYFYIFETPPNPDSSMMRKYPRAPHPFVVETPLSSDDSWNKAPHQLQFGLTLIGRAIDLLPSVVRAVEHLGITSGLGRDRALYVLEKVETDGRTIYSVDRGVLSEDYCVKTWEELLRDLPREARSVCFNLKTPLRLKYGGRLVKKLEFHMVIRNLLRRLSALVYFHCGTEMHVDFKGLIDSACAVRTDYDHTSWYDWKRYSARQDSSMKLGGLVGTIAFAGRISPFLPYLALGEHVHTGKNTSFGLGSYTMVVK